MWATLTFLAASSVLPLQSESLRITHDRTTYGILGPIRADGKFLPGDVVYLSFDMENLKADGRGVVKYSMAMEVLDPKGDTIFKGEPEPRDFINSLGGNRIPACAHVELPTEQKPGDYTINLTIADLSAKKSEKLSHKFTVSPRDFGFVRLSSSYDPDNKMPAPAIAVVGQSLWVNAFIAGFEKNAKKEPNLNVEVQVYDQDRKPTLEKPQSFTITKLVDPGWSLIPVQTFQTLNRAGKYTVEIKAEDLNSKKTSKITFPLTVFEQSK